MYNQTPLSGVATGVGGTALATPWLGFGAIWVGIAAFTLISAALAVRRALPPLEARRARSRRG
jgi:membrane protein implicated in regulation of membrane protease activity